MDVEERVRDLEVSLAAKIAEDKAVREHLLATLERLDTQVNVLTATLNKSRGALWVLGASGAILTAVAGFLGHYVGAANSLRP